MNSPVPDSNSARLLTVWLPGLLLAITTGIYFLFIHQYALNVPLADDIYDVLGTLNRVAGTDSLTDALAVMFQQHNDHRTLASRLLYYLSYTLTGEINFRHLVFLANSAIPALLLALYLMARPISYPLLVMLPAALLVFHLRAYGVILWGMAALAYMFVFLYGYYTILALHRVSAGRFFTALGLASLGSLTLASGQLIWLVGLLSLVHQAAVRKSAPWTYALCWAAAAAVVLSLWRLGFQTPNTPANLIANLAAAPGHHVLYTLTLLGNVSSESSVGLAAAFGSLVLSVLLVATLASWKSADIRLELCAWLVVLSVAAMVLGRSFTDVDYGLSSRYSVPSVMMIATTWVLLASRLQLRPLPVYLLITLACASFNVYAYTHYGEALRPYLERRVERFNRGKFPAWPHPMRESNAIVAASIHSGLYVPPTRPVSLRGRFPGLGTIAPSD